MPTTYAHYTFGNECYETLPTKLKKIVNKHRDLYNIGLHGPDILFYYLVNPKVSSYGYNMHQIAVKEFLEEAKVNYVTHDEKEEMMSYLLGFISHFILDTMCHGYVERKKEVSKITHNKVEAQWDRHLMVLDKRKPNLVDRSESLKPTIKNTKIISYFYPYTHFSIYRTSKWHVAIITIINTYSLKAEKIKKKLLSFLHLYDFCDLFIGFKEEEDCKDSNLRLDKLKNKALKYYPKLVDSFYKFLFDGKPLDKMFLHDFGPWPDYKKIPVYSYKKELTYKVK